MQFQEEVAIANKRCPVDEVDFRIIGRDLAVFEIASLLNVGFRTEGLGSTQVLNPGSETACIGKLFDGLLKLV